MHAQINSIGDPILVLSPFFIHIPWAIGQLIYLVYEIIIRYTRSFDRSHLTFVYSFVFIGQY